MGWIYIVTGLVCSVFVPVISGFSVQEALFCMCLILFADLVLAYVILSIAKFITARLDFVKSQKIIAWETERVPEKRSLLPYYISCLAGVLGGFGFILSRAGLINSLLIALFIAFSFLGWWLLARERIRKCKSAVPSFLLAHNGIILSGKVTVFDGATKGILKAERNGNDLSLFLLEHNKEKELIFTIPEENTAETDAFLADLKDYFNENK